ncbi:glutathione peroxidase [Thioclava sp. DLFJ5-1]|uniref:glutathione peroxidase n=1 Tax=Thioclava sp. DLFJ5-1 TaxID=1915314 RepID=UPI00143C0D13|nr:glutathione peroxidase [Thioclava sp. DLFJ5-1]
MRLSLILACMLSCVSFATTPARADGPAATPEPIAVKARSAMPVPGDLSFDLVEGETVSLADFRGKVVLVVNTASKCGFAPQFTELQEMSETYGRDGLVILTVPSNDFRQELSTAEEAKRYCALTFGAELPMAQLAKVKGPQAHPFYRWMRETEGFEPSWNFNKVLLGRDGSVIATYPASAEPLSTWMLGDVKAALATASRG